MTEANDASEWSSRISAAIFGNVGTSGSPVMGQSKRRGITTPRQTPVKGGLFVGRRNELEYLSDLWQGKDGTSASIVVVSGAPGIGKTAFATFWAQRNEGLFPDGTLHVNLRGFDPAEPMRPEEALSGFLRSIGVAPARIPTSLQDMAALFRSELASLRMLIILDNARSPDQVRPLLPGTETNRVIVTSRSRMSGLVVREGAHRITLDLLTQDEAMSLFSETVGERIVADSLDAARHLIDLSGRLPLALRIIAERAARSAVGLQRLTAELEAERQWWDTFEDDDEESAMRYVFFWSYKHLNPSAARAFRLLSNHPGPDFSSEAAAALLDIPEPEARRRLDNLASVHLVEPSILGRYLFHDLIKQYAYERSLTEDGRDQRLAAVDRVLRWYTYTTAEADRIFVPDLPPIVVPPPDERRLSFDNHTEALNWCEVERANIVAGVGLADSEGLSDIAWKLSLVPWSYYELRKHWNDWIRTHKIGLRNAKIEADALAEAMILNSLGIAYRDLRRFEDALPCFNQSLQIRTDIGDRHGQAINLNSIGITLRELGRPREAISFCERSLKIRKEINFYWGQAHCYHDLGIAYMELAESEQSLKYFNKALELWRSIGAPWGESLTLVSLAQACLRVQQWDKAVEHAEQAIRLAETVGNSFSQADAFQCIGTAKREMADLDGSIRAFEMALKIRREIGHDYGEIIGLLEFSKVMHDMKRLEEAELALGAAETLTRNLNDDSALAAVHQVRSEIGMA